MRSKHFKHIVDILLGIGLLLLMSYQVTGEAGHEWTGIVMTVLMILHQILNRKWYAALFKGKYTPLRTVQTLVNAALVICFVLTALCGINMSVHAVPFLSEFMRASLGRRLHLTLSHWCFVLMGLHLGLHIPAMLHGVKNSNVRRIGFGTSILAAGAGLWLFLKNSYPDYLFYSDDYNTVLMEAQRDQHEQARPAITNPPQSIDEYDVILLGYPNWWASIPMPIATFLESYDFSGKTILPFCSHGGGRFGQSLTAIAKLTPQAVIAPGLSVHYSGGTSLPNDVRTWLESQGIPINQ